MKLASYQSSDGRTRVGSVDSARGLVVEMPDFAGMLELIDGGEAALAHSRDLEQRQAIIHRLSDVRLLAPLMPRSIPRLFGLRRAYEECGECNREVNGEGPNPDTGCVV